MRTLLSERGNLIGFLREGRGRDRVVTTRDYVLALDEFDALQVSVPI